jgi:hypothetical protein
MLVNVVEFEHAAVSMYAVCLCELLIMQSRIVRTFIRPSDASGTMSRVCSANTVCAVLL